MRAVPGVPAAARAPRRRPARPARVRSVVHALPARRQTALVDDYLEIRPEAEGRLERLVAAGRLHVGPWMVLMDEFMVSGETIVRDLQMGLASLRRRSAAPPSGTSLTCSATSRRCPSCCARRHPPRRRVARVPAAIDRTGFWWVAPDGAWCAPVPLRILRERLRPHSGPERPRPRARGYVAELGDASLPGGSVLLMNGADHVPPQPTSERWWQPRTPARSSASVRSLAERDQARSRRRAWPPGRVSSDRARPLACSWASRRTGSTCPAVRGRRALERRRAAQRAVPPVRRVRHRAAAGRVAQPCAQGAHDSSCACSHDEVVEAVRVRYQEARHIEALAAGALARLASESMRPPARTSR